MKKKLMTGEDFIKLGLQRICERMNKEHIKDLALQHINYDQDINENFQYNMIRSTTHDGTLLFMHEKLLQMFQELLNRKTQYKPMLENINLDNVEDIHYSIGDVYLEEVYDVKVEGKNFPMMRQMFTMPVKSTLIMREV